MRTGLHNTLRPLLKGWPCLAPAWLICGPSGVGKKALAQRFAYHALIAPDVMTWEVFMKPSLKDIETFLGGATDFKLIAPLDDRDIPVEAIRTIKHHAAMTSSFHRTVVLIDKADHMNRHGGNALLKTLEDSPSGFLCIVVADQPERLLPTFRSRCVPLRVRPLSLEPILEVLQEHYPALPTDQLSRWALMAEGSRERGHLLAEAGQDLYDRFLVFWKGKGTDPSFYDFLANSPHALSLFFVMLDFWLRALIVPRTLSCDVPLKPSRPVSPAGLVVVREALDDLRRRQHADPKSLSFSVLAYLKLLL